MTRLALLLLLLIGCPEDAVFFPDGVEQTYSLVRDCRFSIEHDGNSIVVYASRDAASAYRDAIYPLPEGTVLVKSEFADGACTDLVRYSAMRKEAGAWQWQRVDAARGVIEADRPETCVACHTTCTEGRDLTCTDP